jgi:hypothetical protein
MLKRITLSLIIVAVVITSSRAYDAYYQSIPKEFVVSGIYDGIWKSKTNNYIYKTVGHRGEDLFVSSVCIKDESVPTVSATGNEFFGTDYQLKVTNSGLSIVIDASRNKCFPVGIYSRIK